MPIDAFSFKGAGVLPFSDRLSKMLSAVDPVSKLHSALTQMVPSAGADLSLFRGVLSDHTHLAALQSEQLRVAIQSGERFKAMSVAAGGGAFSALDDLIGSHFHATAFQTCFPMSRGIKSYFMKVSARYGARHITMQLYNLPPWRVATSCLAP